MSEEKKDSSSNCGANAEGGGGFQPGNTCAAGDGESSYDSNPRPDEIATIDINGDTYRQLDKLGFYDGDDDEFYYHVTTTDAADAIADDGLVADEGRMFSNYAGHSKGRVFFSERSGVGYWAGKVEDHLFHNYDDPPNIVITRFPKDSVNPEDVHVDEVGAEDSRSGSYFMGRKSLGDLTVKSSDCGANQEGGGGFVEGNTCATGEKAEGSGISKSSRDMSEIFGQGAIEEKYTHGDSGGRARVLVRPNGVASTLELYVPKDRRGQGIGRSLMSSIMSDHPKLMGQVSSKAAAKIAYDQGRRPYNEPDATLARVFSLIDDNSSVNLLSPALMEEQTSKSFSGVSSKKSSDCGANQEGGGGFVEGNTCATGEKAQESDSQEDDFDRWFAGSKAVNEKGDPLTVYHGTDADFENFELGKQNKKTFTPVQGLFFTNRRSEAAGYGSRVIEANLSIKNPASREQVVEAMHKANEGVAWKDKDPAKATQYLIDRGFDGAIYQEDGGMGAMYIAFDPKQVRQIKNKKSFGLLSIKKSDCGANAEGGGGFQAGNTCAKGESGKKT
jgi:GNAT superfamily N-acetyltransferase